jgi:hypothetical protein
LANCERFPQLESRLARFQFTDEPTTDVGLVGEILLAESQHLTANAHDLAERSGVSN